MKINTTNIELHFESYPHWEQWQAPIIAIIKGDTTLLEGVTDDHVHRSLKWARSLSPEKQRKLQIMLQDCSKSFKRKLEQIIFKGANTRVGLALARENAWFLGL